MNRREFCKGLVAASASLVLPDWLRAAVDTMPSSSSQAAGSKPNIIFILTDDVGLDVIGCYGSDKYKTPRIDELAMGGTRFEYCFSTPLCGPSRAQCLTGRYPFRTGMVDNSSGGAMKPANEVMIPTVLKAAGYVTAQVGKWAQMPNQPSDWGFDEFLRFQASGNYWLTDRKETYTVNGKTQPLGPDQYLPDMMHDFLVEFINKHKDKPFYVHYAVSQMHTNLMRTPDSAAGVEKKDLYRDNIAYMDKLVGKLMAELDRLKLREKTLVIFTGDNGTAEGAAHAGTIEGGEKIVGNKSVLLEGGSRVPLIVNWTGTTPADKVCHDLTDFSDFFPTFAELGGASLPKGVTIDGRSFAPQIRGKSPAATRDWVYVELAGNYYIRSKRWKLTNKGEFFDMKEAPFKEIAVARDTTDAEALAGRKTLQESLDNLRAKASPSSASAPASNEGKPRKKAPGKKEKG